MHEYARFAEFGGPMNSAVGPQKKAKRTESLSKLTLNQTS